MPSKNFDYKTQSNELDKILEKLQSAELDVDEAVDLYERGMQIAKELETYLRQTEHKISKIKANWEKKGA